MAARIHELRAARAALATEANAALKVARDKAKAGGRSLSAEEKAEQDSFDHRLAQADAEIAIEERILDRERAYGSAAGNLREPGLPPIPGSGPQGEAATKARPDGPRTFAAIFGAPTPLVQDGWKSPDEFFHTIGAGLGDERLVRASAMGGSIGSEGGFLVPTELVARAFDQAVEDEPILRLVTIEPMSSDTKRVAGFATRNHSTGAPFGFSGGWIAEGATLSPEKGLVRAIKLQAKKLGLLVQASNEVAADGLGFDAQLESAMQKALGWMLADAIFNGHGAGQPAGMLSSAATVVVSKEGGQAADTIVYANVVKMLSRLLPACMPRAVFFASHTARPQLMQLTIAVGAAGSFIPLVLGPGGVYRLLGVPIYWTEHLPVLGDQGDLVLCDPSQYVLGMRQDLVLDRSAHVGFTSDLMTYRAIVRADGQSLHDAAFTPKNGNTQGPAVVLEAR